MSKEKVPAEINHNVQGGHSESAETSTTGKQEFHDNKDKSKKAHMSGGMRLLVAGLLVILIAIAVAAWLDLKPSPKTKSTNQPTKLSDQDLTDKIDNLVANKQYDQANQLIKNSAQNPKSMQSLELQATVAMNAGDYSGALKQWQYIAGNFPLDANIAQNLALSAENAGDKPTAITYYQKAIDLVTKNPYAGSGADIAYYQSRIQALQ